MVRRPQRVVLVLVPAQRERAVGRHQREGARIQALGLVHTELRRAEHGLARLEL